MAAAAISDCRMPSCGAATRRRLSNSGAKRVENCTRMSGAPAPTVGSARPEVRRALMLVLIRHHVAYLHSGAPATQEVNLPTMRSASLIREARLRAGLTQTELAERTGRDRSVIARWEQAVVAPSLDTLLELVRACGFDLPLELMPYDDDRVARLQKNLHLSPERRVRRLLTAVDQDDSRG